MTRAGLAYLAEQPRPERLRVLWEAMSPKAQAVAWAFLTDEGRVELIAACFYAEEVPNDARR